MTMHVRLSKARQLAQLTDMRALEIAVRTGFSSASNLHRAYRDHYAQGLFDARHPHNGRPYDLEFERQPHEMDQSCAWVSI